MKKLKNLSVEKYLVALSRREPVPGGGSAAALNAGCAAALMIMVARYSLGKTQDKRAERKIATAIKALEKIQGRLTELVDLDAESYAAVVKARKTSEKNYQKALKQAAKVPKEVCLLCYKILDFAPLLALRGNKNLIHDLQIAVELLYASFNSAQILAHQ